MVENRSDVFESVRTIGVVVVVVDSVAVVIVVDGLIDGGGFDGRMRSGNGSLFGRQRRDGDSRFVPAALIL